MSISILNRGASGGMTANIIVNGLSETDVVTASKDGKTVRGKWLSAEESGMFAGGHPECIVSTKDYLLYTFNQSGSLRNYKKAYADEAYACSFMRSDGNVMPLLVGKTAESVAYYTDGNHSSGVLNYSTTVEYLGEMWYVSGTGASYQSNLGSISTSNVIHLNTVLGASFATGADAALAFLEYAAPKPVGCHEITGIKDLGLWTVTATDGERTKTQDILIEVIGLYEIEMSYTPNYIMLYDFGDECEDVTGGWSRGIGRGSPTYTKNADNIYLYSNGYNQCVNAITAEKVEINECSEIRMYAKHYYSTTNGMWGEFAVVNSTASSNGWDYTDQAVQGALADLAANNTVAFFTLDVSDLSGEYYPVVRNATGGTTEYTNIYAMFLTKADNWQTLCSKAGISAPSDLATLIADTASITTILTNETAVKYMVSNCTGDFMASFVANSTCLSALNSSPYKSIVTANKHWAKFLAMVQ